MSSISVLILTHDEEKNLPVALASLHGLCDDVIDLDSYSTDSTTRLAVEWGARVVQREFDNYAAQRRAGLALEFRHPWVLMMDADELVTRELWEEMEKAVASAGAESCMFRMRRKDMFLGRWLRRSSGYPTWFGRLVRPGMVRIEREVNEEYIPLGRVANLEEHLLHFPFNRGVSHWIDRHNTYSTMECAKLREERSTPFHLVDLLASDPVARRRALKRLAYRLPMRPLLVFVYLYFVRFGMLDGRAGLIYCRLRAAYELMIDVKRVEQDWRERQQAL